jgi:hypothetical protein
MGRGRGKPALAFTLGAIALSLLLAACGAEDHPNDPRPPNPIEVSVNIDEKGLTVSPSRVAYAGSGGQKITVNEGSAKPEPSLEDTPQIVTFTVSNTTDFDTKLEVDQTGGAKTESGPPIVANGVGTFRVALDTGAYMLTAADIPAATGARFSVGPDRVSSQDDLLLP